MLFRNFTAKAVTFLAVLLTAGLADAAIFSIQVGPILYVLGDAGNNECAINVDLNFGTIDVEGSDQTYFVEDISRIIVWTYGGDDNVTLTQSSPIFTVAALEEGGFELPLIAVDVLTSWGDDTVTLNGDWGSTRIITGFGSDDVNLGSEDEDFNWLPGMDGEFATFGIVEGGTATSFRDLYVDTGFDDDEVSLHDVVVGFQVGSDPGFSWSQIYTGAGFDQVEIDGYSTVPSSNGFPVRTFLLTGADDDEVSFTGSLVPFDYFDAGSGVDSLFLDLNSTPLAQVFILNFEEVELD